MRRYRCDDCRGTSRVCFTDGMLAREARKHEVLEHAGLTPDGARVVNVPVTSILDIPRGQLVAILILAAVLLSVPIVR